MSIEHPNLADWGCDLEFPIGWRIGKIKHFQHWFSISKWSPRGQLHDLYFHVSVEGFRVARKTTKNTTLSIQCLAAWSAEEMFQCMCVCVPNFIKCSISQAWSCNQRSRNRIGFQDGPAFSMDVIGACADQKHGASLDGHWLPIGNVGTSENCKMAGACCRWENVGRGNPPPFLFVAFWWTLGFTFCDYLCQQHHQVYQRVWNSTFVFLVNMYMSY